LGQTFKYFEVTIEETVAETFDIEACSLEEALGIVGRKYRDGKIVLEPGELMSAKVYGPESGYDGDWQAAREIY